MHATLFSRQENRQRRQKDCQNDKNQLRTFAVALVSFCHDELLESVLVWVALVETVVCGWTWSVLVGNGFVDEASCRPIEIPTVDRGWFVLDVYSNTYSQEAEVRYLSNLVRFAR